MSVQEEEEANTTMEVEPTAVVEPGVVTEDAEVMDAEEEEDTQELEQLLEEALNAKNSGEVAQSINVLLKLLNGYPQATGIRGMQLKERAIYELTRSFLATQQYDSIVKFVTVSSSSSSPTDETSFMLSFTKAKTAKVTRQVLEIIVSSVTALNVQEKMIRNILAWTVTEKRHFLKQRVERILATVLYEQSKYNESLDIVNALLLELKKLDDKQLLVEAHLLESQIYFALQNITKAKSSLTACRTAANVIYVPPLLQADIDQMSGTIYTADGDYNTAYSYFLEAFEQLDQLHGSTDGSTTNTTAKQVLRYMILCRILDALRKALSTNSEDKKKNKQPGASNTIDLSSMISAKQMLKYSGPRDMEGMIAIGTAATKRDVHEFQKVMDLYKDELLSDVVIQHHLLQLHEQLLESNLLRILEPYSCVELTHIASLMKMPLEDIEKKLSQMILDHKLSGIINQGDGQLILYETDTNVHDGAAVMEKGLTIIQNMDSVVTSLFTKSQALRTMML
jgi:26S proteasome regulatory subunit N6